MTHAYYESWSNIDCPILYTMQLHFMLHISIYAHIPSLSSLLLIINTTEKNNPLIIKISHYCDKGLRDLMTLDNEDQQNVKRLVKQVIRWDDSLRRKQHRADFLHFIFWMAIIHKFEFVFVFLNVNMTTTVLFLLLGSPRGQY